MIGFAHLKPSFPFRRSHFHCSSLCHHVCLRRLHLPPFIKHHGLLLFELWPSPWARSSSSNNNTFQWQRPLTIISSQVSRIMMMMIANPYPQHRPLMSTWNSELETCSYRVFEPSKKEGSLERGGLAVMTLCALYQSGTRRVGLSC